MTTINEQADRMTTRYPQLATMAAKALALAEGGAVTVIDDRRGEVVNGDGHTWHVCFADDGPRCECPAWQYRPVIINDHLYCKHTVAFIMALNVAGEPAVDDDEPTDEEWYAEMESGYWRDVAGSLRGR